jgi:hypothetical protein
VYQSASYLLSTVDAFAEDPGGLQRGCIYVHTFIYVYNNLLCIYYVGARGDAVGAGSIPDGVTRIFH